MPNQPSQVAVLIPFVVVVAFFYWMLRRQRSADAAVGRPRQEAAGRGRRLSFLIFLILVGAIYGYFASPRKGRAGLVPPALFLLPILIMSVLLGVYVFVFWLSYRDPVWNRCRRRADEGDVDGAIREMREAIEDSPPSSLRMNNLGALYAKLERHEEALDCFRQAEALGGRGPVKIVKQGDFFRVNQAVSLRKLGRPDEALPLLEAVVAKHPQAVISRYQYALVLADLGRFPEAREQLRKADAIPRIFILDRAGRLEHKKFVKETRDRIDASPEKLPIDMDGLA